MTVRHQLVRETEYVVVGGGTAGCIVAARLAEAGHSVMLIEAGGPYRRRLDVPLLSLWTWLRNPERYCWNQHTVPQARLDDRRIWFPGGRILGGGSAINAMLYTRGHAASWDAWNVPGWTFADLLPYHRRAECHEAGASEFHGGNGPMGTGTSRNRSALADAFIDACAAAGMEPNLDFNGRSSLGAGYLPVTQRGGRRASTGNTYFRLARRHRAFGYRTGVRVSRILLEDARVTGVECAGPEGTSILRATREVILSAGTVRSPELLLRSGVGPAADLHRLGIPVAAHLPGVGASLQDQLRVSVPFRYAGGWATRPDRLVIAGARYALTRRGLLASNVCDAGAVISTTGQRVPDARIVLRWRVMPETGIPLVDLEVTLLAPSSRGRVTLHSPEPTAEPAIDPRYLDVDTDLATLERAMDVARQLGASPSLRAAGFREEYLPGARPVAAHVRATAGSAFHPVGTCRMGVDDQAVVDPALRLRGVAGLRIVDASVIPGCVTANAQAGVIAVAEKASDLVLGIAPPDVHGTPAAGIAASP